jgi:RNA polymerase sigma-70 factor (ECF subfamily)
MSDLVSDQELVARVAGGDRAAFSELMRRHEDMVFAVCLRVMGNRDLALDATQETFITLFRKADRFRGESALSTWLYRVATNTCFDLQRKARRRAAEPLPEHHDPADHSTDDALDAIDVRGDIASALGRIPQEFRAAVILADAHGLPLADVAEILGVPVGTVKSRVFRARRLLAEQLGNLNPPPARPRTEDA